MIQSGGMLVPHLVSPAAEGRCISSAAWDAMTWMSGRRSRTERLVSLSCGCKKQGQRTNFHPGMFSTFTFLMSKLCRQVTGITLTPMNDENSNKAIYNWHCLLTGKIHFFQCMIMRKNIIHILKLF